MSAPASAIFGLAATALSAEERAFFREVDPFGFILFARNVATPAQLAALTADLRATVGRDAPVLVDQEGGRVARLRGPCWRDWQDVRTMLAALPEGADAAALRLRSALIAHELRAVGIDVNCFPLLDVPQPGAHPFLRDRALGGDAATVARLGHAARAGLAEGGVAAVIKHLPGHGRGDADSHQGLPVARATLDELRAADFAAIRPHADAAWGMSAHVLYPALDPELPGTLSPAVVGAIRGEIGFGGLLLTDDISMGALTGPIGERAAQAVAAGCDVVLHCDGAMADMRAVAAAVPRLAGAALARAEAALAARPAAVDFDAAAADAALAALLAEAAHA